MAAYAFLAIDLGAESGRALLGRLEDRRLTLQEVRRFPNGMLEIRGHVHWNVFRLFEEIKSSLREIAGIPGPPLESLGIDTWGVDFALLAADGTILGLPFAYRDVRTLGVMEKVFSILPREVLYNLTGIQFLPFNSIFQLYSMRDARSPILDSARDLLFMPDLFNYLLTGTKSTEFTYATTSQLYNPGTMRWEDKIFSALNLPRSLMQEVVGAGSRIGLLEEAICRDTGAPRIPVVAVASHDTGSAVAAVPASGTDWAFISSGTWSLMGVETPSPIITDAALAANFTNEGGVGESFRFLKNIAGLWPLQECRRKWAVEGAVGYEELLNAAGSSQPFQSMIDVDDPRFLNPPDMPEAIREFCRRTGQPVPASRGDFVRTVLESLAMKYRTVLDQLRTVSKRRISRIHIIGGGSRNRLLCQFTANVTGIPVTAGPAEATGIGNLLMQALSLGHIRSLADIRDIVRNSFQLEEYLPEDEQRWSDAFTRFLSVTTSSHTHS